MQSFEWLEAKSQADAAGATTVAAAMLMPPNGRPAGDAVVIKAGGIDLLDLMKEGLLAPRRVVNLRAVPGLDRIVEENDGTLRIGALVTLATLGDDARVRARYAALADAVAASASPQIRNVATLGGNLLQRPRCWYFRSERHHCVRKGGETCFAFGGENQYHAIFDQLGCAIVHPSTAATALVALGAKVALAAAGGSRREVRLEDFLLSPASDLHRENDLRPGEILTEIVLPQPARPLRSVHLKQGERDGFDWPVADVAVALGLAPNGICETASIVLGAAAPVPHRAKAAEAALIGAPIGDGSARAAARAALAGAMPLSKNAYKLPMFETLVRRAILAAAAA
ncbi:MAG TPA: FAD binding domain-containing protein [Xanthobacteraceae bacterium]|nr:FAD binding domain-containing protein [Xanthobacteraceae bacterium]